MARERQGHAFEAIDQQADPGLDRGPRPSPPGALLPGVHGTVGGDDARLIERNHQVNAVPFASASFRHVRAKAAGVPLVPCWGLMFERFTDRARRVVVLALEEARMRNHNYIGTEHLLLGLIQVREGVAARALESMNISAQAVLSGVEDIISEDQTYPTGHIPFTPRAKRVLELSLREALQLGHNHIGTEHILLGLMREGEGVAAQVLGKLGADLARVREQVVEQLTGYIGQGPVRWSKNVRAIDTRLARMRAERAEAVDRGDLEAAVTLREAERSLLRQFGADVDQVGPRVAAIASAYITGRSGDLSVAVRESVDAHFLAWRPRQGDAVLRGDGSATLRETERLIPRTFAADLSWLRLRVTAVSAYGEPGASSADVRGIDASLADLRRFKEEAIDREDFRTAHALCDAERSLLRTRGTVARRDAGPEQDSLDEREA